MILEPDSREFFSWPGLDRKYSGASESTQKKYLKICRINPKYKIHTEFSINFLPCPSFTRAGFITASHPFSFHGVSVT
jgi:hypothetical protein